MILKTFWKWLVGAEEPKPIDAPLNPVVNEAGDYEKAWLGEILSQLNSDDPPNDSGDPLSDPYGPPEKPESSTAVVNKGGDYDRGLGSIRLGITSPIDPGYIDIYGGVSPDSLRAMPTGKLCALKHALIDFDARAKRWKTSEINSQADKGGRAPKQESELPLN